MSTRFGQQQLRTAPLRYATKSGHAHRTLRKAILDGTLTPGERIKISRTAKDLQISETPVREALKLLESEGLVIAEPHTGYAVTEISYIDIAENLLLRREIESLAARLSAPHLTSADLGELNRLVGQMDRASSGGHWKTYARLNKRFHHALIARCPLKAIRELALNLWEAGDRTRRLFAQLAPLEASNAEHRAMLEAIEAGEYTRLDQLVRSQKTRGIGVLLSVLSSEDRQCVETLLAPIWKTDEGRLEI